MKKIIALLLCISIPFILIACSEKSDEKSKSVETTQKEEKKDFEGTYEDMGNGKIYLLNESGSTEDGKTPIVFSGEPDNEVLSIGIEAWEFDGSKLSYVYIDGIENTKKQYGDTQSELSITGEALKEGTHKVEVVQYDTDKPDGKVITYKTAQYEVKKK